MQTTTNTIAIIGGGAAGTLTAYHLITKAPAGATPRVVIIDPRPSVGLGLAYSTPSLLHLLNVPTAKISALPCDPGHFIRWIRANYDPAVEPFSFMPRAIFGRYLQSIYSQVADRVEHIAASATDMRRGEGNTWNITLSNGSTLAAGQVVLATGNFDPPLLPGIEPRAIDNGVFQNNAWGPRTYDDLQPESTVALIGTGLTGVDVILRLRELGHTGRIVCISRRVSFPSGHIDTPAVAAPVIDASAPRTALGYLRALRAAIAAGIPWRAAIDSLRTVTNDLWLELPYDEQRRVMRHLMRRWMIVRHRMAPHNAALIADEIAAGTLVLIEGSFGGLTLNADNTANITVRSAEGEQTVTAARVINCTGPSASYRNVKSPLLQSLFAQGIIAPGPFGAYNTTRNGAMIGANGVAANNLYNVGPGRLGNLFESIAIPEIRDEARALGLQLLANIGAQHLPSQQRTATTALTTSGGLL